MKHLSILDYAMGKLLLNQANMSAGATAASPLVAPSKAAQKGYGDVNSFHPSQAVSTIRGNQTSSLAAKRLRELAIRSFSAALRSDTFNLSALKVVLIWLYRFLLSFAVCTRCKHHQDNLNP